MAEGKRLNWGLSGHSAQLGLLEKALASGRLAHAYIFSGPAQVGKRAAARRLAQFLLCATGDACGTCDHCKPFLAGTHADYLELGSGAPVKIEDIRDLGYKLSLRPYAGKYKVAVIDDAHLMTTEAANALLKVLEEPKPNTLLVLVTDNFHRLLPTISSRAQKLLFGPVDESSFAEWLAKSGLPKPDPAQSGRPGYVMKLAEEPAESAVMAGKGMGFEDFLSGTLGRKLLLAQQLAEMETAEIKSVLEHWLAGLAYRLRQTADQDTARKVRGVVRAQRMLDRNGNSRLLLTDLMLQTT